MCIKDKYDRGQKLSNLRKKNGLSTQQLAQLTDVSPALISQVERNHRIMTDEALEKIAAALGLQAWLWMREWRFEELAIISLSALKQSLVDQKREGTALQRPTLTCQPKGAGSNEYVMVAYRAHRTMMANNMYTYVSLDDEFREVMTARSTQGPVSIFNGGASQIALFEAEPGTLSDLVIDAHIGEETYFMISGEMEYVVMKRPEDLMPRSAYLRNFKIQDGDPVKVRMESEALDLLICEHREMYFEDSPITHQRFIDWLNENVEPKPRVSPEDELPPFYYVPAERFLLKEGDILRVDSKWPHGGLGRGKKVQALFSAVGSYIAADPNPTPQE